MSLVEISEKEVTFREAIAQGEIRIKPDVILKIKKEEIMKGNVIETARIAGIMAAKSVPQIIPLCHPISLEGMDLRFDIKKDKVTVIVYAKAHAKTGVEMEALTAVSAACLTIYDMCKAYDKAMVITEIMLLKKIGGKSGEYVRQS